MALHIVNHHYHLDKINEQDDKVIIIGNFNTDDTRVIGRYDFYESQPILQRLFNNSLSSIIKNIENHTAYGSTIYFWGLQDNLSYQLSCKLKNKFEFVAVPDNLEFFLRTRSIGSKPIRNIIKALTYRQALKLLKKEIGCWCGRFTYPLPDQILIDHDKGFYNLSNIQEKNFHLEGITFISQPYNIDYGISTKDWINITIQTLNNLEKNFGFVDIKFHQRDTIEYKKFILEQGFEVSKTDKKRVAGFFSTMLFEKALTGLDAYLLINNLKNYLPNEYFNFSEWVIKNLLDEFNQEIPIKVKDNAFQKLKSYIG